MTARPITTKLGPDQEALRRLIRRLAEAESTEAPILSVYIDVRPEAHGERPAARSEIVKVREALEDIAADLEPHTPARTSVDADVKRIFRLLETEDLDGVDGLAIFACDRIGLWEVVRSREAFDTEVRVGPTADLFQLARLLDDQTSAVIAIVDTNTCRLFVTRRGGLDERPGPDEPPDEHKRHKQGGWSQARYQRHVDMQDKRFAKEAAAAIERLVERERPRHVILAGDERAMSVLDDELSEAVRPLVEYVARLEIEASRDEVREEVLPILAALEEADGQDAADRALAEHRARDLGVAGIDAVMAALEMGQVHELVIDEEANLDEELRAELIRQASLTDARVEIVRDHPGLRRYDGVAATLRFRISWPDRS
ncbi:MAG TPA: Vms1/Ankzf1 family peptidyl-tRNA hydrolase [Candidatus Limnocylindria bacterium]|nr:Vms1/Ankzf1 family peptidyl-tRNA hydrolase [Candidatus Limnocylindria bacterium]